MSKREISQLQASAKRELDSAAAIEGKWKLESVLEYGGQSTVYTAKDEKRGERGRKVVVKRGMLTAKPGLQTEIEVYKCLSEAQAIGFVQCIDHGQDGSSLYLVLERLDRTICNGSETPQFDVKTVARIGRDILRRLEDLHELGYAHGDVKPDNILVGAGRTRTQPWYYLIDFASTRRLTDSSGNRILPKKVVILDGSPVFSPISWHGRVTPTEKDDLESLLYSMVFLHKGELPWESFITGAKRYSKKVLDMKKSITCAELCEGMPDEFSQFCEIVRRTEPGNAPSYTKLDYLLATVLKNEEF